MRTRDLLIYAAVGLSVWLNGAVTFRIAGRALFQSGPLVTALVAVVIAIAVCVAYRATMAWRGGRPRDALTICVVMALPGLFAEALRQLVFHWATGLPDQTAPVFNAVIFFGNGALLTYALILSRHADQDGP